MVVPVEQYSESLVSNYEILGRLEREMSLLYGEKAALELIEYAKRLGSAK